MKDYAFTKQPTENLINALIVDSALQNITSKLDGVTVTTHSIPWIIFVHTKDDLTEEEVELINQTISSLEGETV